MADFQAKICEKFNIKSEQIYNGYCRRKRCLCWHEDGKCKARSDWLQLPLAALHINRHRVTSKIRLTMPRVKMSRADRNPWLAKMLDLKSEVKTRDTRISSLQTKLGQAQDDLMKRHFQNNDNAQYTRKNSVRIFGVEQRDFKSEHVYDIIQNILKSWIYLILMWRLHIE